MWLLFHGKTRTRAVPGGRSFEERCPACRARARFHEVEVETAAGAFLIDVVSATDRAFRCGACGEVFDRRDDAAGAAPPPTTRSGTPIPRPAPARDLLAELEREQAARADAARVRAASVEDELAALKRKLGKS